MKLTLVNNLALEFRDEVHHYLLKHSHLIIVIVGIDSIASRFNEITKSLVRNNNIEHTLPSRTNTTIINTE